MRSRDETGVQDMEGTYEDEPQTGGANLYSNGGMSQEAYHGIEGGTETYDSIEGGREGYGRQEKGGLGEGERDVGEVPAHGDYDDDAVDGDAEEDDDTITITLESLDKTRHRSYVVSRNDTIEVCMFVCVCVCVCVWIRRGIGAMSCLAMTLLRCVCAHI